MATIRINGARLYYEETGAGPETIVFSHGLLWDTRLYDPQVARLGARYRCLAYDHRGQGRSDVPETRSIDLETLYRDAVGFIEAAVDGPCHFVGLSMGGFVGMRVAARRPDLIRSLTLIATQAGPEPPEKVARYRTLNLIARLGALRLVAHQVMPILFGQTFMTDAHLKDERRLWQRRLSANRRRIYRAVNGVLDRKGVEDELERISAPTLVLRGEEDAAIKLEDTLRMRDRIHGAMFAAIPKAGHSCTVEQPEAVNAALETFLDEIRGYALADRR